MHTHKYSKSIRILVFHIIPDRHGRPYYYIYFLWKSEQNCVNVFILKSILEERNGLIVTGWKAGTSSFLFIKADKTYSTAAGRYELPEIFSISVMVLISPKDHENILNLKLRKCSCIMKSFFSHQSALPPTNSDITSNLSQDNWYKVKKHLRIKYKELFRPVLLFMLTHFGHLQHWMWCRLVRVKVQYHSRNDTKTKYA